LKIGIGPDGGRSIAGILGVTCIEKRGTVPPAVGKKRFQGHEKSKKGVVLVLVRGGIQQRRKVGV